MTLAPGCRIHDYVLVERIGQGAFSEVWKAAHAHLPRLAALKIARSASDRAVLERESQAQFGLRHPAIVEVLDVRLDGDRPAMVLELVEGKTLRQLLAERGRFEVPDASAILRQLLDAIEYAHAEGVVHGDIKPENILIARRGRGRAADWQVKLTDFHVGRPRLSQRRRPDELRPSLGTRAALGTARYMAPEQERGDAIDARADFFALGVVVFEMLTGTLPQGRDLPSDVNPAVSWWWDHMFSRCYTGRERRYASAAELRRDLDAAATGPAWGELPSQRVETEAPSPALAPLPAARAAKRTARSARRRPPPRPQPTHAGMGLAALALATAFAILIPLTHRRVTRERQRTARAEQRATLRDRAAQAPLVFAPTTEAAEDLRATARQRPPVLRARDRWAQLADIDRLMKDLTDTHRYRELPLATTERVDLTERLAALKVRLREEHGLEVRTALDATGRYTFEVFPRPGVPLARVGWRRGGASDPTRVLGDPAAPTSRVDDPFSTPVDPPAALGFHTR